MIQSTTVLTHSQRVISLGDSPGGEEGRGRNLPSGLAVAGGSVVLPGLRAEERLLLGLVDGRLSVARLARLAGLSEDATARHLQSLCDRRMLVPVESGEVTIRGNAGEPFFRLGPYEVASRLGQGGMGSVYVCRRLGAAGFRRLFALKVVRQGSGQEHEAERSFLREIRVGVLLDHPNTQSVVDVGMYKNQPFLVLQYIVGTSLEEVSFGRRVPPGVLVTILIDVLRGLHRAHELNDEQGRWLGLVHGDVSAPNVLVGIDGVARLTDFGSARFTAFGETGKGDAIAIGKPAYMAPEQLLKESLDARTDLFGLGTLMWTALTGQELFAAESYEQTTANVLGKEIGPPSAYGAPACLDEICLRALSRARDGRPRTAEDMAQTLLKIGVENGLLASASAVGEYMRREVNEGDLERRRRLDAAFQDAATAPLPVVAPTVVTISEPAAAEKKFARTLFIPPPDRGMPAVTLWLKDRWRRLKDLGVRLENLGVGLKELGLKRRGVIFVVFWSSLALLAAVLTVAIVHKETRSRARPPRGGLIH